MKYYTNGIEVRAYEDNIDVSKWIDLSKYRRMTDEEVDRHIHPEKYKTESERIEDMRAAMVRLTPKQFKLVLALNGHPVEEIQKAIDNILNNEERTVIQYEWDYALEFERTNPHIDTFAKLLNLTPTDIDILWEKATLL